MERSKRADAGSTVPYAVERIAAQGEAANQGRWFVPTGFQSKHLIIDRSLSLGDIDNFPQLDVTIDGADEVDAALNVIKGGGACHLREKIIAEASDNFVIVADFRKKSRLLGENWKQGIPVEVVPPAALHVLNSLKRIGSLEPKLRMGKAKAGPVVTDNGNFCIDAPFPEALLRNPQHLLRQIKLLTGVVEVGLFTDMACAAFFGNDDGTISIQKQDGSFETRSVNEAMTK